MKKKALSLALAAAMALMTPAYAEKKQVPVKEKTEKAAQLSGSEKKSAMRDWAYAKAGSTMYSCLKKMNFPYSEKVPDSEKPFDLKLNWKAAKKDNFKQLPLRDFVYLNYCDTKAINTNFNMNQLKGSKEMFDEYFKYVSISKKFPKGVKEKIKEHEKDTREKSSLFYLAFNEKDVQLVYYPSGIYFHGGYANTPGDWVDGTPYEIKTWKDKSYRKIENKDGLIAIFNGMFAKEDSDGGFGYDYKAYLKPLIKDELATVAIYEDGSIDIKKYSELDSKKKAKTFVQNMLMILDDGKIDKGANTGYFSRYEDDMARSYIFKDKEGRFGYIWTTYLPPYVLAKVAKQMNIKDMALLDIHSPIYCRVSRPDSELSFTSKQDYKKNSFNFIPQFSEVSALYKPIIEASKLYNSRIQVDYMDDAFSEDGSFEDFFAVYLKGSQEAKKMTKQKDIGEVVTSSDKISSK